MGAHRLESNVLVIGRKTILSTQIGCTDDLGLHYLYQARFANPRLVTQQHDVPPAGLHLRPAVSQEPHLVLAAHQWRETAGRRDVEALLHLGCAHDLIHLEGRGHASKRLEPERLAGEISLD